MLVVAVVDAKLLLLEISVQVLNADLVERADDGTLEQAPDVLDSVGVYVTDNPFLCGVVDVFVPRIVVSDSHVGAEFVGVERFGFVFGDRPDESVNRFLTDVGDSAKSDLTAPLQSASNPNTLDASGDTHRLAPVSPMTLARIQHRFVQLDHAEQRGARVQRFHRFADSVAEVPRGFVSRSDGAADLVGTHGLLAFDHEVDSGEPLPEREFRVVEDRSRSNREAIAASVAIELVAGRDFGNRSRLTARADRAVGPAEFHEVIAANLFRTEPMNNVNEADFLSLIEPFVLPDVCLIDFSRGNHV